MDSAKKFAKYHVEVIGCDDTTHIFMDMTPQQAAFLAHVARCTQDASLYQCMPVINLDTAEEAEAKWANEFACIEMGYPEFPRFDADLDE